jgi:hypothetical protein
MECGVSTTHVKDVELWESETAYRPSLALVSCLLVGIL